MFNLENAVVVINGKEIESQSVDIFVKQKPEVHSIDISIAFDDSKSQEMAIEKLSGINKND